MRLAIKSSRLGLRNSVTRIPFRYGGACLERCPQAVVEVVIETAGHLQAGYGGDCLPPAWFDKSPDRDYAQQITDMLATIEESRRSFCHEFTRPRSFIDGWWNAYQQAHAWAAERSLTPLLASFGVSLWERALMDAIARVHRVSFATALRNDLYEIDPGCVHSELTGMRPVDWIPDRPLNTIYIRHTVGLGDPLTLADMADDERLDDQSPQTLEEYLQRCRVCYLKIKLSNQLDHDIQRLTKIGTLLERHLGTEFHVTLDGNEQYSRAEDFEELLERLHDAPMLETIWKNTLLIEQPLARNIALDNAHTEGIRQLAAKRPVIIDESDGTLGDYPLAMQLGYRGVSSKACKGPIKSILNAGLTWRANNHGKEDWFIISGEDLCSVGVIPVQTDLCLAATLGIKNVERNGHHYHPGLNYLSHDEQQAALAAHPDFYSIQGGRVVPRVIDGKFQIQSLQCQGFGFAVEPDFNSMESPEEWRFESLG